MIDEPNFIAQIVSVAKPAQADLYAASGCRDQLEFFDQTKHVGVDIVGSSGIEQKMRSPVGVVQHFFQSRTIEKTDLICQLDVQHFAADMSFECTTNRSAQVADENKDDTRCQSDDNTNQKIGENNGDKRDDERQKLVSPFTPHIAK